MRNCILTVVVWAISNLVGAAIAHEPVCRPEIAEKQLARALEARDGYALWEGIDDREAQVELERYIARLETTIRESNSCELESIRRTCSKAANLLAGVQSAANRARRDSFPRCIDVHRYSCLFPGSSPGQGSIDAGGLYARGN